MIRVLFSSGDLSGVDEYIQKINDFNLSYQVPHWLSYRKAAWQVRSWLAQNKVDTAINWAEGLELKAEGSITYHTERDYISFARILIEQQQCDEAIKILDRLREAVTNSGNKSRELEVLILHALVLEAEGDSAEAVGTLEQAFSLAEPAGFFRIFVDEGPKMAQLLYNALDHGISPNFVSQLLKAFPLETPQQIDSPKHETPLIEKLSKRETEVLVLIADGLTNQEIAARLFLSLNTVKVHTRNIFQKLSVTNRTEAVARAKGLGILL
jgi:LuxR family maltose regulon positive regulatory protein